MNDAINASGSLRDPNALTQKVLPVSPERFLEVFHATLEEAKQNDPDWAQKYARGKTWTPFIMKVLEQTGRNLGFTGPREIDREFYRLDMAYYSFPEGIQSGLWNLEVAIEHENDASDWIYEFVKLAQLRCGLKVLISYYESEEKLEALKREAQRLLGELRYKASGGEEKWLLLFGPMDSMIQREWITIK